MITLYYIMCYALIVLAFFIAISGLDDMFFDFFYWGHYLFRKWKTRNYEELTYEELITVPEKKIAVLVPCWHESNIIKDMLKHNIYSINYDNYDFFIGVYPNDPDTVVAVQECAITMKHIQCVIGEAPGPTTKASNLNIIYSFIEKYEKQHNIKYEILVFHDSEDIIHPLSFLLYNYLIPRKDMVQLPVFPLEVSLWDFTHWVYNDEFAENHTKDIIVREAVKAEVPSAGVATAFARSAIDNLAAKNNNKPFSANTLTEDYHIALLLHLEHLKTIFVTQKVKRTVYKKHWLFGKLVPKQSKEYVASRALFPTRYADAVKQKARWITGIAFQEWEISGFPGDFMTRYVLLHDRKSLLSHFVNVVGYFIFLFWLIYSIWVMSHPEYPTLQEFFNQYYWIWYLVVFCTFIMFERLLQRFIACFRVYGFLPALLSIPRALYGNIINMHALLRAYKSFFFHITSKRKRSWDKTNHTFPAKSLLKPYQQKLGDILVRRNLITPKQLYTAINEQLKTGDRLGECLVKAKYLSQEQLNKILAEQHNMELIKESDIVPLKKEELNLLSKRKYRFLIRNNLVPINLENNTITLAIPDPNNEKTLSKAIKWLAPYKVKFVLRSHD